MRKFAKTPDEEAVSYQLVKNPQACHQAIMVELLGVDDMKDAAIIRVRLPKGTGKKLQRKKLLSLAKKYPMIPSKFLRYYPTVEALAADSEEKKRSLATSKPKLKKSKAAGKRIAVMSKKRKPGRPKNIQSSAVRSRSILNYFQSL